MSSINPDIDRFLAHWSVMVDPDTPDLLRPHKGAKINFPIRKNYSMSEIIATPAVSSRFFATDLIGKRFSLRYLKALSSTWRNALDDGCCLTQEQQKDRSTDTPKKPPLLTHEFSNHITDVSFSYEDWLNAKQPRKIDVYICMPESSDFVGNLRVLSKQMNLDEVPERVLDRARNIRATALNARRSRKTWPAVAKTSRTPSTKSITRLAMAKVSLLPQRRHFQIRRLSVTTERDPFSAAERAFERLHDTAAYIHVIRGRSVASLDRYHEIAICDDGGHVWDIPPYRFWGSALSLDLPEDRAEVYTALYDSEPEWRSLVMTYFEARRLALDGYYNRSFRAMILGMEAAITPVFTTHSTMRAKLVAVSGVLALEAVRSMESLRQNAKKTNTTKANVYGSILRSAEARPLEFITSAQQHYAKSLCYAYDARNYLAHQAVNQADHFVLGVMFEYFRAFLGLRLQARSRKTFAQAVRSISIDVEKMKSNAEFSRDVIKVTKFYGWRSWTRWGELAIPTDLSGTNERWSKHINTLNQKANTKGQHAKSNVLAKEIDGYSHFNASDFC